MGIALGFRVAYAGAASACLWRLEAGLDDLYWRDVLGHGRHVVRGHVHTQPDDGFCGIFSDSGRYSGHIGVAE